MGISNPNGNWVRATRDDAGRITKLATSNGKSRQFSYDARGALTDYIDALGRRTKFEYNRRGQLNAIVDNDGVRRYVDRDKQGRITTIGAVKSQYLFGQSDVAAAFPTSYTDFRSVSYVRPSATRKTGSPRVQSPNYMVFPNDTYDAALVEAGLSDATSGSYDPMGFYWNPPQAASDAVAESGIPFRCWQPCAASAGYAAACAACKASGDHSDACTMTCRLAAQAFQLCWICLNSQPGGGDFGGGGGGDSWGRLGGGGGCTSWYEGDTFCSRFGMSTL